MEISTLKDKLETSGQVHCCQGDAEAYDGDAVQCGEVQEGQVVSVSPVGYGQVSEGRLVRSVVHYEQDRSRYKAGQQ